MLYADGWFGALHGKVAPVIGELSELSTLKGTGEASLMWALATPMKARAARPWKLRLESMALLVVEVVFVVVVVVVVVSKGLVRLIAVS